MDKFAAYLGEGVKMSEPIEELASATPAQLPAYRQNIENFVSAYTPRLAPALKGMQTPELQKLAKKVIGGVHYHKVFDKLPDYFEASWTNISKQLGSKLTAYGLIEPSITALGAAYGVEGKMDKAVKAELDKHMKTFDGINNGTLEDKDLTKIVEEIAKEETDKISELAEKQGEKLTERETTDYKRIIGETFKEHKDNKHFRSIMGQHYSVKFEESVAKHEPEIVSYLKSIATGVYEEAPTDLMRNYEKFKTAGGVVGDITKQMAAIEKMKAQQ